MTLIAFIIYLAILFSGFLCATIDEYFNIAAESEVFKRNIDEFEQLRNNYKYRSEYF